MTCMAQWVEDKSPGPDLLEAYWEHGMTVWAQKCTGCGRWAKVVAFHSAVPRDWVATECDHCGIRDSRRP
jgi:hypothetical protein